VNINNMIIYVGEGNEEMEENEGKIDEDST